MKIIKFLRDVVIAPHGVTDISHSIQTNNQFNLLSINSLLIGSTNFIINEYRLDNMINIIFLISSIIHFRHDMPNFKINNIDIPRYILCSLMFISIYFLNHELIIYYMLFQHVPNHFKFNEKFIKNDLNLNIFLLSFVSIICLYFDYNLGMEFNNIDNLNLLKSLIISHVIYQEKFVLNNGS